MSFLTHPRRVWIRRANFQIHLWAGVILALYAILIGVSGSVLVFGSELGRLESPGSWPPLHPDQSVADASTAIKHLRTKYPDAHIVSVMAPTTESPVFTAVLQSNRRFTVACHPLTGEVLSEIHRTTSRLDWIYDLHENLLSRRRGRVVNGICASALLLLTLTGLVNWWPGVQRWRCALIVDFRRGWRRITFDLHGAVGLWLSCFLIIWASTGVYFTWPDRVLALVERLSPVVNSRPRAIAVDPNADMVRIDFYAMFAKARALEPGGQLKGIVFPSGRRSPFEVLVSRAPGFGRDYEDTLYFNPYNGKYLATWQYGINKSLGDWLIWLQIPLHFGTHWGLGIKCLWAAAGLALPTLSITGLLMYWNRFLGKQWARLEKSSQSL